MLTKQDLIDYRATRNAKQGIDPAKYTEAQADQAMCELLSHTLEELVELRMCINRKAWKPMPSLRGKSDKSLKLKSDALDELADVLLMLNAFMDMAGFTLDEVADAVSAKCAKNLVRPDHVCNQKATT